MNYKASDRLIKRSHPCGEGKTGRRLTTSSYCGVGRATGDQFFLPPYFEFDAKPQNLTP